MGNNPSTSDRQKELRRQGHRFTNFGSDSGFDFLQQNPQNKRHGFDLSQLNPQNKRHGVRFPMNGGGASFSDFYHEVGKENKNTFMNGMAVQVGGNKRNTLETILNWLIILYAVGLVVLVVVRLLNPDIPFTWCYDGFLSVSALLLFVLFVPTVLNH